MSEFTDQDRRAGAREQADLRGETIIARLARLRVMWREGKTDAEIATAFGWTPGSGDGWSPRTVRRWRWRCGLTIGNGRDRSRHSRPRP